MRHVPTLAVTLALMSTAQISDAAGNASTASRSAVGTSRSRSASRPSTYRPATNGLARSSTPGARSLGTRRSLLEGGAQPSPKMAQIIRERESSGPGWLGTAFLVALLSRHDLSDSDRQWLQTKIDALAGEDESDDASGLAPPLAPSVTFLYAGIQGNFAIDRASTIHVTAQTAPGNPVAVNCTMREARITAEGTSATLVWEPHAQAVYVLTCQAGGQRDRRLLKAG